MPTTEQITKQIKQIRKSKRIKIHDCAALLGFPKETYLGIEEGITPLTLPELELLAIYFGVEPTVFFNDDHHSIPHPILLNDDIRSKFMILRMKMIRAVLAEKRKDNGLTWDDIQMGTDIPVEILHEYNNGDLPIPLNDLIKITDFLSIPVDLLLNPVWDQSTSSQNNQNLDSWQPEFVEDQTQEMLSDADSYGDLIKAIQKLPKDDQAQFAKSLLEKLRGLEADRSSTQ